MKLKPNLLTLFAALALGVGFTACAQKEAAETATTDYSEGTAAETTCPVSGEPLGSMGEPIVMTHEGKEVKLCCKSCIKKFEADPAKYAAMVD
jgi:YHS domain-containing protein